MASFSGNLKYKGVQAPRHQSGEYNIKLHDTCLIHSTSLNNTHLHAPLGIEPLGSPRMASDVCMHALHITQTNNGLWPRTHHTCQNTLILYLAFYNFKILNMLILGIVLPRLMQWCLYSFVFETP
jgi:hypothetical protein